MGYAEELDKMEQFRALAAETEGRLWEHREQLAAIHVDVAAEVARLRADLMKMEVHFAQLEAEWESRLSEMAGNADARRELFIKLERLVSGPNGPNPTDAARLGVLITKLRKEMPLN